MSSSPMLARWSKPVPLDSYPEPRVPGVVWQMQARIVVRTKYLSEFVSAWRDADDGDLEALAAEVAEAKGLHFRLAEPKESLNTEWVVLPPGVVNESVVRLQVRRKGELAAPPTV